MSIVYTKEGVIKAKNKIVLYFTDEEGNEFQTINPTHEMLLEHGWVQYFAPELTVDLIKTLKLKEIDIYDISSEVNSFYLNDNAVWLNKADRVGLMNSILIEKAAGREKSVLWFGGVKYEIECDMALLLLSALELYALECYNITASHKANVQLLETSEEIADYDYTIGYPEKLTINI